MSHYLDKLNSQQREAVEYLDGPQLVIAGAGSGKTRVLTYKIVHLLAKGYEPWRIMALTFTNKAAREMRDRVVQLSGQSTASRLFMGTFHSVFARILRSCAERIGYNSNFTIYDTSDSRNLIKAIIRDMGLDEKVYAPNTVASIISNAKNALCLPSMYADDYETRQRDKRAGRPLLAEIYRQYVKRCRIAGAMDFDDLLVNTNLLLRDNPDIRHHYQEFFRYILVDEYQDTNFAQHMIVCQLSGETQHVCMVGDDAQSIYSFRGASIANILNLKQSFPAIQTFKLEQNYRSTRNIINAAGTLIEKNRQQIPKKVFSANGTGDRIQVVKTYSDYEESFLVANKIIQLQRAKGYDYNEFAILYRTNAQSRVLEESLRKRNIPYRIYGGKSFYDRKEVKDAIAYFRLSVNPSDDEALRRVINFPARGIGETTMKKLMAGAIATDHSLWETICDPAASGVLLNTGTIKKLSAFTDLIHKFNAMTQLNVYDAARAIVKQSGMLALYVSDSTPENVSRYENLQELLNYTAQFVSDRTEEGHSDECTMQHFLAQAALSTDADKDTDTDAPMVTLMTIHAAKGLEFSNIFVVGVEEDLLPSAMSSDSPEQVEEERRLLYVAITRAKHYCMLSYATSRYRNGQTVLASPSRFLHDIDRQYLEFTSNDSIDDSFAAPMPPKPRFTPSFKSYRPKTTRNSGIPLSSLPPTAQSAGSDIHTAAELTEGMTIEHTRFGRGIITNVDANNPAGDRIMVNFNNIEIKTLLLRFAKFRIIK